MTLNLEVIAKGSFKMSDVIRELSRYGKVRDYGRFGAYHAISVTGSKSDLLRLVTVVHKTCEVWSD